MVNLTEGGQPYTEEGSAALQFENSLSSGLSRKFEVGEKNIE